MGIGVFECEHSPQPEIVSTPNFGVTHNCLAYNGKLCDKCLSQPEVKHNRGRCFYKVHQGPCVDCAQPEEWIVDYKKLQENLINAYGLHLPKEVESFIKTEIRKAEERGHIEGEIRALKLHDQYNEEHIRLTAIAALEALKK